MIIHPSKDGLRRAVHALSVARGHLDAVLHDPGATEAQIAEALRRAAGNVRVLMEHRRGEAVARYTGEEAQWRHE